MSKTNIDAGIAILNIFAKTDYPDKLPLEKYKKFYYVNLGTNISRVFSYHRNALRKLGWIVVKIKTYEMWGFACEK